VKRMLAAVFYGINDVRVEERDIPTPGPGEVVIKVKACAVCGTDLRIIRNGHKAVKPPAVIGHEIAGIVAAIDKGAKGIYEGDSVIIVTPVGCGNCRLCKAGYQNMCDLVSKGTHSLGYYCDGGFSEYMRIPAEAVTNGNLIKFDYDGLVSWEELSLIEPFSCVINGQKFLRIIQGETVAIFGCGAIGCMHAYLARYYGASNIIMIDINKSRIEMVSKLGIADSLILSTEQDVKSEISRLIRGAGVDSAIVACSSAEAQRAAFEVSGIRSKISLFAGVPAQDRMVQIDTNDIHYLEKSVFGAFASAHHQYREALDLIVDKKISLKKLISRVMPLEKFNEAMELFQSGGALKVVIRPDGG